MAERVLVVDDDELERRRVVAEFARAGMVVAEASNAVEGLIGVLEEAPEVIVLSEEIPPLAADDVVSVLRRLSDAPLIILGSGQDPEEVSALDRGADAYLRRPLSSAMLLARARALLRRYRRSSSMSASRIRASGLAQMLSGTEKRLLLCLASNGSGLISQDELLTRVWRGDRSPDVAKFYLRRLRNKLEKAACGLRLVSLRGGGHRLVQAETERASFHLGAYRRRAT